MKVKVNLMKTRCAVHIRSAPLFPRISCTGSFANLSSAGRSGTRDKSRWRSKGGSWTGTGQTHRPTCLNFTARVRKEISLGSVCLSKLINVGSILVHPMEVGRPRDEILPLPLVHSAILCLSSEGLNLRIKHPTRSSVKGTQQNN